MDFKLLLFVALTIFAKSSARDSKTEEEDEEVTYFSPRWTDMYSGSRLSLQPKWIMDPLQSPVGDYETRIYIEQVWAGSFEECWTQEAAESRGYTDLYFYFMGFNPQRITYPVTYPILVQVDKTREGREKVEIDDEKDRLTAIKTCDSKYTTWMYIPTDEAPATPANKRIQTVAQKQERKYVMGYAGNYTAAYCNEKAVELKSKLDRDGVTYVDNIWFCATYCPGKGSYDPIYEVWYGAGA